MTSAAFEEMHKYAQDHAAAGKLLNVATEDYAAARCLRHSLLMNCLVAGAQAAEKFLKAHILFLEPTRKVKDLSHSLGKVLKEAHAQSPTLGLDRFNPMVEKFERHYRTRYPDTPNASTSMTTADIGELDDFVILLNENLPCPRNYKYRMGLYAAITFSLGYSKTVTPTEHWIKLNNVALAPLLPKIEATYAEVMAAIHPS